ncbi:hypothetical protein T484DRAFT_1756553 [Baffinella frigidus]|nr:hypothetical protein T484DRAFT_1756553 [Cryptophyta sp. CCMP2293]
MHTRVVKRACEFGGSVDIDAAVRSNRRSRLVSTHPSVVPHMNVAAVPRTTGRRKRACDDINDGASIMRITRSRTGQHAPLHTKPSRGRKRSREVYTTMSTIVAAKTIIRFMCKYATTRSTTRTLVLATLPPVATAASPELSAVLGHSLSMARATSAPTLRCMRRFLEHTGLFIRVDRDSNHADILASRVLRAFDVCGNTDSYTTASTTASTTGYTTEYKPAVELHRSAQLLSTLFCKTRYYILKTVSNKAGLRAPILRDGVNAALCLCLRNFDVALSNWYRDNSEELQHRTERVLFNVYDTETVLRAAMQDAQGCCVPKPFLASQATFYQKESDKIETKFLKASVMFDGVGLIQKMKSLYRKQRQLAIATVGPLGVAAEHPLAVTCDTHTTCTMRRILQQQHAQDTYSQEAFNHESVLDTSFRIKHAHVGRDDKSLRQAINIFDQGRKDNLRLQMCCTDAENGTPVYAHALLIVVQLRKHLQELNLHTHCDLVLGWLDVKRWKKSIETGQMTWTDVVGILKIVVYAMRYCIGTDVARKVLYDQQLSKRMDDVSASVSSCTDAHRVMCSKPRAYTRLMGSTTSKITESVGVDDKSFVCGKNGASPHLALDRDAYIRLRNSINALFGAEHSNTTAQLWGMFCEMAESVVQELQHLDVNLCNAEMDAIRLSSMAENVETEQLAVQGWFDQGLGTTNTYEWMKHHACASTVALGCVQPLVATVFRGYISLIMDETALQIEEVHYPELTILDIPYIHTTRGMFYGQVAQATVLVLLGQRLTDAGVSHCEIEACLRRVAADPAFVDFGHSETCRGEKQAQNSLREMARDALDCITVTDSTRDRILQEVARETCHRGYPKSVVAASIARKWAAATAKSVPDASGQSCDIFASAAHTRDAFSSGLLLPNATRYLAHDFHFSTMALVQRVVFNVAVHYERYRELMHKMDKEVVSGK